MTLPRIYLPGELQAGMCCGLESDKLRYMRTVLRLKAGDAILLFNGQGTEGDGVIDRLDGEEAVVRVLRSWSVAPPQVKIILAQSLPKAGKMDLILQKATELGVGGIIPFTSRRSVPKLDKGQEALKQRRWQKIVVEAAKQCRRANVPEVSLPVSFVEMLGEAPDDAFKMILWEEEMACDIKGVLRQRAADGQKTCFVVVGPEGGFAAEEIALARDAGFIAVGLGRHILRTETAALAVITIVQYERGELFDLPGEGEA